jgi:hypothetical protein
MSAVQRYFSELAQSFGDGWNRFWFTPRDVLPLSVLRVLTGLVALAWLGGQTADLVCWFGPHGLLPLDIARQVAGGATGQAVARLSWFYGTDSPGLLWTIHVVSLLVVAAFTVGWFTRISNVLSLVVVLSYIHRAPLITGQLEPVLTMVLAYLCLAPTGDYLSVDRWRRKVPVGFRPRQTVGAAISQRLLQVHVAALSVMIGLTMLAGQPWWNGTAMWLLIARTDSRLVDLSGLHRFPFLVNAWTHGVVAFQLLYGVLIWHRLARPLLLAVAVVAWSTLAAVTGLLSYCLMMLAANVVFLSPDSLGQCYAAYCGGQRAGAGPPESFDA